jgi:hypothetical protein
VMSVIGRVWWEREYHEVGIFFVLSMSTSLRSSTLIRRGEGEGEMDEETDEMVTSYFFMPREERSTV